MRKKKLPKESLSLGVLILLTFFLFTFRLGDGSLWDADEAIYGEVAREIWVFKDWVTLHYNYQKWFEKPPLYFWLTALNIHLFGPREFAVRLWSTLFGLGGVIITYFLGRKFFNHRTGIWAGVILATSLLYLGQSRLALLDTGFTFFLILSFLFVWKSNEKPVYYLGFFISLGMAVLTKGPMAIIIAALILIPYFLRRIKNSYIYLGVGMGIFLVLVLPWYLANLLINREDFLKSFLGYHHFLRFLYPIETHGGPIYYYLVIIILGFFPWSAFLPAAFLHLRKNREPSFKAGMNFLLFWIVVVLGFLSLSRTKLPGYILPVIPALSLVTGYYWEGLFTRKFDVSSYSTRLAFVFLPIISVVLTGGAILLVRRYLTTWYYSFLQGLFLGAGVLIFSCLLVAFFSLKNNFFTSFVLIVFTVVFFFLLLLYQLLPRVENYKFARPLSSKLSHYWQPGDRVVSTQASASLVFYGNYPVNFVLEENLESWLQERGTTFLIISRSDYQKLLERRVSLQLLAEHQEIVLVSNHYRLTKFSFCQGKREWQR